VFTSDDNFSIAPVQRAVLISKKWALSLLFQTYQSLILIDVSFIYLRDKYKQLIEKLE